MSAEAWDNQYIELTPEELMESCVEMTKLLDQTVALIKAFKNSGDERLLDILLEMIGMDEEDEEGDEDVN